RPATSDRTSTACSTSPRPCSQRRFRPETPRPDAEDSTGSPEEGNREDSEMAWTSDRKRFAGALILFLAWVALLVALAVVSAYRPASRSAPMQLSPDYAAPGSE